MGDDGAGVLGDAVAAEEEDAGASAPSDAEVDELGSLLEAVILGDPWVAAVGSETGDEGLMAGVTAGLDEGASARMSAEAGLGDNGGVDVGVVAGVDDEAAAEENAAGKGIFWEQATTDLWSEGSAATALIPACTIHFDRPYA